MKLGVAVLGTGWVSGEHIKAFQKNPHTDVVAILSRQREKAEAAARQHGLANCRAATDLDEILKRADVHIVSICTPNHLHAPQGIAAASAGKHLLVEKPMALTFEEVLALDRAVAAAGVKSVVSFVLRWNPLFDNIKAMIAGGLLGELFYAGVDYLSGVGDWYTGYEWMRRKETGGSNLLSAGCHAIDAARWFVQSKVTEVYAVSNTSRTNRLGYEYDTNSVTLMKFANGTMGKIGCSVESANPYFFNILLQGDAGSIRNNEIFTKKWPGQKGWAPIPTILPDTAEVSHHPFVEEVSHLVECVRMNVESHCSVRDAVETHRICLASGLSAKRNVPVDPWGDLA
ncbi:MAG: Gfo/Idh/MocA family protein [Bryobacteraceae bacterium]